MNTLLTLRVFLTHHGGMIATNIMRKSLTFVTLALLLAAIFGHYVRKKHTIPSSAPAISLSNFKTAPPLVPGEPPRIAFVEPNMNSGDRRAFLATNYRIIWKVADLPPRIANEFIVEGGTQISMADPGEKFESTDFISDPSLPRRRLIFAGIASDRAFLHFERGGIGESFIIDFFRLKSPEIASGAWEGYCDKPAKALDDLRQHISDGRCY